MDIYVSTLQFLQVSARNLNRSCLHLSRGTIKLLNIVVEIETKMENLGLTPRQLNAIVGLFKEGKIQNLFAQAGESTEARSGASQVNDLSRSGVAQVNKAVNYDAYTGAMQENNINGKVENSASDIILPGVGNSVRNSALFC